MSVQFDWLCRDEYPAAAAIDRGGPAPWSAEDFAARLRDRAVVGLAARVPDPGLPWGHPPVAGFVVYRTVPRGFEILRLGVAARYRRRGVGRAILRRMGDKLSAERRTAVTLDVPDGNLAAHLWLRACGWRAESVEGDCYRFAYRVPAAEGVACGG